jgi:hypothetical protein
LPLLVKMAKSLILKNFIIWFHLPNSNAKKVVMSSKEDLEKSRSRPIMIRIKNKLKSLFNSTRLILLLFALIVLKPVNLNQCSQNLLQVIWDKVWWMIMSKFRRKMTSRISNFMLFGEDLRYLNYLQVLITVKNYSNNSHLYSKKLSVLPDLSKIPWTRYSTFGLQSSLRIKPLI